MTLIRQTNVGSRRLPCRLDDFDRARLNRELLSSIGDVEARRRLIADVAAYMKQLKESLAEEEAHRDNIGATLNAGQEERSVDFDRVLDYGNQRVIEIRPDTGEAINVRDMNDSELQMTIAPSGTEIDGSEIETAVVLYFNRAGRAERVSSDGPLTAGDVEQLTGPALVKAFFELVGGPEGGDGTEQSEDDMRAAILATLEGEDG